MTACACTSCELCVRRAALDLDDLRETAARLASHAGLPELAGRALDGDAVLCAKIVSTSAATLAFMLVGDEDAAAGAALRCNELMARMSPTGRQRVQARVHQIASEAARVPVFARKGQAS